MNKTETGTETVHLAELTWPRVRELIDRDALFVLPIGATEQHGHHLPLGTDWRLAAAVAERACERLAAEGLPALLTPPLWPGFSPHHMEFPGTVTLSLTTFLAVVRELAGSLWRHGARRIVLLNGHGGNAALLKAAVQQLRFEDGVRAVAASYWDLALPEIDRWRASGPGGIDHACELETALMQAIDPALVGTPPADLPWTPRSPFLGGDLTAGGAATVAWSFAELSDDGVLGAPSLATPARGRELLEVLVDRLAAFLREVRRWEWDAPREI